MNPRRRSVTPAAIQMRVPAGNPIIRPDTRSRYATPSPQRCQKFAASPWRAGFPWFLVAKENVLFHGRPTLLIRYLYRKEVRPWPQPPLPIELPPTEHLVGIHIVSSCHSRYRGIWQQRLFHDGPPRCLSSPTILSSRLSGSACGCVHDFPFVGTHFTVHTPIILIYIVVVHTVGTGRLLCYSVIGYCN